MRRLMAFVIVLWFISGAMAQSSPLTTSVTWRVRVESWNFFDPGIAGVDESYIFAASLLRAGISGKVGKSQDWRLELSQVAFSGLPENSIAPAPAGDLGLGATYYRWNRGRDGSVFLKQAYWQWRGKTFTFRLGRFEFSEGTERMPKDTILVWLRRNRIQERLIGPFGFAHVQRSFDGLLLSRDSKDGNFTLTLFRPTRGAFDLKGNDQLSDVTVLYASWTSSFDPQNDWRLFALHYRDKRDVVKTSNTANIIGDVKVTTLGGHYLRTWQSGEGKFDTVVWGAWQFGDWGWLDHKGHAYSFELGYQWTKTKWQPWLRIGYFHENLSLRLDWHKLWLSKRQDLWYAGGGAFNNATFGYIGRPSGGSKRLMDLIDLSVDYSPNPNMTWTLYLAKLMGKEVVRSSFPANSNGFFAFLEFNRRW